MCYFKCFKSITVYKFTILSGSDSTSEEIKILINAKQKNMLYMRKYNLSLLRILMKLNIPLLYTLQFDGAEKIIFIQIYTSTS